MKNKISTLIIVLVAAMILMTGCTSKKNQDNAESSISVQNATTAESTIADETEEKSEESGQSETTLAESTEDTTEAVDTMEVESEEVIEVESGQGTVGL